MLIQPLEGGVHFVENNVHSKHCKLFFLTYEESWQNTIIVNIYILSQD